MGRALVATAAFLLVLSGIPTAHAMQALRDDFLAGTTPAAVGSATTAYLNSAQQTLTLPSPPDTVATGLAAGTTVTVLDGPAINTYQWTGSGMTLNSGLSLASGVVSDPLGVAVVQPGTLAVLTSSGVQVYQYTGSGLTANPNLAWTGVSNPLTVTASQGQLAVATQQNVQVAALTSAGWATESTVTPSGTPWDASLAPDGGGLWTIANGTLQEYLQTGSGWGTSPNLAVTGAVQPIAAAGSEGEVTAVTSGTVNTYNFNGTSWSQNPFLSIGSGLTQPTAVAMIPRQMSLSVLDGSTLRLFEYTGTGMAEVASARVSGIQQVYVPQATAESPVYTPTAGYEGATLRPDLVANGGFDTGTTTGWTTSGSSVVASTVDGPDALALAAGGQATQDVTVNAGDIYFLSAWVSVPTGSTLSWGAQGFMQSEPATSGWTEVSETLQPESSGSLPLTFSASGGSVDVDEVSMADLSSTSSSAVSTPSGTSVSWAISADGGNTWNTVTWGGSYQTSTPSSSWEWQATLQSTNPAETPVVQGPITLLLASPPAAPQDLALSPIDTAGSVTSLSPTVSWKFESSGGADAQTGYEVEITDTSTGTVIYNSGKVSELGTPSDPPDASGLTANDPSGAQNSLEVPGSLLASHPQITVQVRTWDLLDLMSHWASANFNVFAVGPLQVTKIYDPPSPDPNPTLPTTALPVTVLAGAQFDFTLGSTGPVTGITAQFSDGGAPVSLTAQQPTSGNTNTWDGSYYTNGNLATGTTVDVAFTSTSSRTGDQLVLSNIPIVVTDGSVYSQYYMILTK